MGPSGAGKTTLGKIVAEKLGFIFVDIDEYIWKMDTEKPFTVMYSREEKISRLMNAISEAEHFVMAGSMDSFHEHFDPFFELVVYLYADTQIRVERARSREQKKFGNRVQKGGDMYEEHLKFLEGIAGYDLGFGGTSLQLHQKWLESLSCKVIRLDGKDSLEQNTKTIIEEYKSEKDV